MFLELVSALVAGLAASGLVLLLNKILGGRLPRWLLPVAAGVGMLAATIASEYGWYSRTKAKLPDRLTVVETVESKAFYRPWTYLYPFVERFAAVDKGSISTHQNQPGRKLADTYYFGRWSPAHKLPVLVDCIDFKRAALSDGISFESDGTVKGADWVGVPKDDPMVAAICGGK